MWFIMYVVARILVQVISQSDDPNLFGKTFTLPLITSIETKNDTSHIGSTCEVVMPVNARIQYQSQPTDPETGLPTGPVQTLTATPRSLFQTGDQIIIKAKYDGYEKVPGAGSDGYLTIFNGYIYDFYQGMPLKIKCLDGVYLANQGVVNLAYPTKYDPNFPTAILYPDGVSLTQVLGDVVADTGITLITTNDPSVLDKTQIQKTYKDSTNTSQDNPLFQLMLYNIHFTNMSPAAALEYLKKELGLCISLMYTSNGWQLYYNIASNTLDTVILSTGKLSQYPGFSGNVIKSNLETTNLTNIKQKVTGLSKTNKKTASIFQKFKVKAWFLSTLNDGTKQSLEVGDADGQIKEVFFYAVKASGDLKTIGYDEKGTAITCPQNYYDLAEQALLKVRQAKFSGTIETRLYPFCDIFDRAIYYDLSYPERNGTYVITQKSYKLDSTEFKQTLKLAYLADVL